MNNNTKIKYEIEWLKTLTTICNSANKNIDAGNYDFAKDNINYIKRCILKVYRNISKEINNNEEGATNE